MIGEREIASGFHSFWSELLPLLTPSSITIINRSYGQYIQGHRPVDVELRINQGELKDQDLLAETSFEIFSLAHRNGIVSRDVLSNREALEAAWIVATAKIGRHRSIKDSVLPSQGELSFRYIEAICLRYEAFRGARPEDQLEIHPALKGCGILGVCEADISIGRSLVEVKTVSRNFSSRDIRQVVLYLALDAISGDDRWSSVVLFNPRRAWYVSFDPYKLLEYISAGRTAMEVYRSIEDLLLSRDFVVDHTF